MPNGRALPRMVERHTRGAYQEIRRSLGRSITCYIAVAQSSAQAAGYDDISGSPIFPDAADAGRGFDYRVVNVPARVRWEGANSEDPIISGVLREGACTVYLATKDSGWLTLTQNSEASYIMVDGQRMKVVNGPNFEGLGDILEHSYLLNQYSRDGTYTNTDGGDALGLQ